MRVAGLAFGPAEAAQWGRAERAVDFYDVKADLENLLAPRKPVFVADVHPAMHPGRCARVELDGQAIGHIGELHPKWRQAYELPQAPVLFELQLPPVITQPVPVFRALQRLQPVWRDLALVVRDEVTHDALVAALCADGSGLVASATLFDIYKPPADAVGWKPGERSLAVRLELQPQDATLTEESIQAMVDAALARAHSAFGARLRT
jgi:phenylalanyl-tRNA synthetase beta chain